MRTYFCFALVLICLCSQLGVDAATRPSSRATTTTRVGRSNPKPTTTKVKAIAKVTEPFVSVDNDRWGYTIDLPARLVRSDGSNDAEWTYALADNSLVVRVNSSTDPRPNDSLPSLQASREQGLRTAGYVVSARKVTKHWYSTDWSTGPRIWHEHVERQQDYTVTLLIEFDATQSEMLSPIANKIRTSFLVAS